MNLPPLFRASALIPVTTLVVVAALALPPDLSGQDPAGASRRTYVSNNLGMALEEIGWYRQEEFPYILVVVKEGEGERRTLLHNGQPVRRWELDPREEREYEGSQLVQLRRYDDRGRPVEEELAEYGENVLIVDPSETPSGHQTRVETTDGHR